MTPDQLNEIEARANAVPADEDEQAIRILAADVLALVARVRELEAGNVNVPPGTTANSWMHEHDNMQMDRDIALARVAVLREAMQQFVDTGLVEANTHKRMKEALATLDPAATALTERLKRAAALVAALGRHHPYHDDLHPDVVAALDAYLKAAP